MLTENKSSIVTLSRDKALNVGPEPQPKFEESKSQTPSSTLENEIAAFKRVISSVSRVKERTTDGRRRKQKFFPYNELNEYFVSRDGIDREVIIADICHYLGNDALVRLGRYKVYIPCCF